MQPVAILLSYPRLSMAGRAMTPITTTPVEAMPDMAAISVQAITVPTANPPLMPPDHRYIISNRSSATPERSSTVAISTKRGAATRVVVDIMEKVLATMINRDSGPQNIAAKTEASPPRTKATGSPRPNRRNMLANSRIEIIPISIRSPQFPMGALVSATATISRPVTAK